MAHCRARSGGSVDLPRRQGPQDVSGAALTQRDQTTMRVPDRRTAGIILGLPVAAAAADGIAYALQSAGTTDAVFVPLLLLPMVVYGYLANRWWAAFPLPVIVAALYLGVLRIVDWRTGGCSVCGEDEDWSNYPYFFLFIAVLPATVCVTLGVGLHRARDLYGEWRAERAYATTRTRP
jgi:hypothetical protein